MRPIPLALSFLLALGVVGCESGGPTALTVEIVDGAGLNPVSTIDRGLVTLRVSQAGATDVAETVAISGGLFDVAVPIGSYGAVTTIEVTIRDDETTRTLVGATLPFIPFGYGRVRIVVGAPGSCVPISSPHLPVPLDSPALVLNGVNLLVFGGRSDSVVRRSNVHALSPIEFTLPTSPVIDLGALMVPMGRSRGASLGPPFPTYNVLVLSDSGSVLYDAAPVVTGARDTPLSLAAGANSDAAIVELGELGVAVVGGSQILFVDRNGATRTTPLSYSRTRATAARLGDGILVAGGGATGADLFEWHPVASGTGLSFGAGLAQRVDASLAVNPTNDTALFLFGRSPEDDTLVPGSLIVSGCPSACSARVGPDVPTLRSGAVAVPRVRLSAIDRSPTTLLVGGDTDDAVGLLVPSGAADSVSWDGGNPVLEAEGGLVTPRSGLAALPLGASVVLVGGGTGPTRVLDDLELCF